MIKTGIFLIKKITKKKLLSILIFFQLNYVGTHFVVTLWLFGGHRIQTTFDFKPMLHICEIDLFTYPTLTKRPAEIALPGCDNDNKWKHYLRWLENTLEPSN